MPISHKARQIATSDFTNFTHILTADESNLRNLHRVKPSNSTAEVRLWGSYLDNKPIADPYYGNIVSSLLRVTDIILCFGLQDGFDACYQQCVELSNAFLDEVIGQ